MNLDDAYAAEIHSQLTEQARRRLEAIGEIRETLRHVEEFLTTSNRGPLASANLCERVDRAIVLIDSI